MLTRIRVTFSFVNATKSLTHEFLIEQDYTEEDLYDLVQSEIVGVLNAYGDQLILDTIDKVIDLQSDDLRTNRYN